MASTSQTFLPLPAVAAILAEQDELLNESQACYYDSVEELVERASGQKNWTQGETFIFASSSTRYVVMKQIAPSSCEMLTLTNAGFLDVFTAYRYPPGDLKLVLERHMAHG